MASRPVTVAASLRVFRQAFAGAKAWLLSDYAKGVLRDAPALILAALERGLPVVIDPKGSDFERYRGAYAVTPNPVRVRSGRGGCGRAIWSPRLVPLRDALPLGSMTTGRPRSRAARISAGASRSTPLA